MGIEGEWGKGGVTVGGKYMWAKGDRKAWSWRRMCSSRRVLWLGWGRGWVRGRWWSVGGGLGEAEGVGKAGRGRWWGRYVCLFVCVCMCV